MPHDMNGKVVHVGAKVSMVFEVKSVEQIETGCNMTLQAKHGEKRFDGNDYLPTVTCNTRLCKVVADPDWMKEQQR